MSFWRWWAVQRPVLCLLLAALLLPTLAGCASRPPAPRVLALAGIVVDGARLARPGETGLVSVWRAGQRIEGAAGLPLQLGDRIETGFSATAVVRWPSGSEIYLRPNSRGVVGSFTDLVGEVFAKIRGVFAVETQFVRAGALSTQYLVRSLPGGGASVTVVEGRVEVVSLRNAWPAVVLGPGTTVLAHPQAPQPQAAAPGEMQRTREWVQQVEKLVPRASAGWGGGTAAAVGVGALLLGAAILAGGRDKKPESGPSTSNVPAAPGTAPSPGADLPQRSGSAAANAPPLALAAPTGTRPGTPDERSAPQLVCRDPLSLQWERVNGARDYLVQLELRNRSGQWVGVAQPVSAGASASTPPSLSGLYRWRVQARQGGTVGPFSAWLHVQCSPFRLG